MSADFLQDLEDLDLDETSTDDESGDPKADDPATLRAELAAARAREEAIREEAARLRAREDEWLRGAHNRPDPKPQAKPLPPMPDPADREAFARWDAERDARRQAELDARLERREQEAAERDAQATRMARLWDRFREKYPSLAAREALAGAAYRELATRGTLPKNDESIVDAVRDEMRRLAGERQANRSGGTTPSGKNPRREPGPKDEHRITMHESITKRKKALGLI
jgi:hypothetical protein